MDLGWTWDGSGWRCDGRGKALCWGHRGVGREGELSAPEWHFTTHPRDVKWWLGLVWWPMGRVHEAGESGVSPAAPGVVT